MRVCKNQRPTLLPLHFEYWTCKTDRPGSASVVIMRLRSRQRRCWSSLDDLCGRPFANTAHLPRLHGRSETELSDCALQDTRCRLCCEATLRGEHGTRGMEVGAGFPVYHRPCSLRYSLLRGATQRHSRDCSVFRLATARSSVLMVIPGQMNTHGAARSQAAAVFPRTQHTIASIGRMADTIAVIQPHRCG